MLRRNLANSFNPSARTVGVSNVSGFEPSMVLAIVNMTTRSPAVIYDAVTPGFGFDTVSGTTMTLETDTSAGSSDDNVLVVWDDGQAVSGGGTSNPAVVLSGSVTPGGTAAAVGAGSLVNGVLLKAAATNTGTLLVGGASNCVYPLAAGESVSMAAANLVDVYASGDGTDTLYFVGN